MDDLLLLIISSPSGAGKTTLTRHLLERFDDLTFSVSHTTRSPRGNELDGRDYHFVGRDEFEALQAEDQFAESAEVHGNLYGTARSEIDRAAAAGKRGIVFDIDYQGAQQIKARLPGAVGVFVLPPSMSALKERLRTRASDDEATIERRYANARHEIENYGIFDYVLVNDDLDEAKQRLAAIIEAERGGDAESRQLADASRRERMTAAAEALLSAGT